MVQGGQRRLGRATIVVSCALACVACATPAAASFFDPARIDFSRFNVDLAVSSDDVVHGVTRSQGRPIVQAQLGWTGDSGWTAGAWLSTIKLHPGPGPRREIDPYIGKRWTLGRDWSLRTDTTRYMFRPGASAPYDYTELRSALSFRDVVDVAVGWSPDYSGYSSAGPGRNRTMLTYEASGHFPATRWLSLNAGLGRRNLQDVFGVSYWYWSAGAETAINRVSFAVSYIGTSHGAGDLYGSEYAGNRMVATVALRLR
ncbi:MAG TPA: TorF family putative porin [Steroidobacteraceae bacterium]|nr:TorF family putative porin [Steroidobacteraceae bacterium]